MKKIFCIVVTYNGIQWIKKCLDSLVESSCPLRIVVVDNGSTDTTVSFIKINFPHIRLIETGNNSGFGQANNIGFRIALENKADHIFLLNQDAWIGPDTISLLLNAQVENPEFGILSPVHLNGAGTGFDANFSIYLMQSGIHDLLRYAILADTPAPLLITTGFVNAAAWLISADCLEKTGGFDPIFFHYGEDRNFTQRAIFKGFKTGIHTKARIWHDREQRITNSSPGIDKKLKEDGIHFLNYACDPQQKKYNAIIARRFLRYTLMLLKNISTVNVPGIKYNYGMARLILLTAAKIRKSRREYLAVDHPPHLQMREDYF